MKSKQRFLCSTCWEIHGGQQIISQ